jgi:hypothetical protein
MSGQFYFPTLSEGAKIVLFGRAAFLIFFGKKFGSQNVGTPAKKKIRPSNLLSRVLPSHPAIMGQPAMPHTIFHISSTLLWLPFLPFDLLIWRPVSEPCHFSAASYRTSMQTATSVCTTKPVEPVVHRCHRFEQHRLLAIHLLCNPYGNWRTIILYPS